MAFRCGGEVAPAIACGRRGRRARWVEGERNHACAGAGTSRRSDRGWWCDHLGRAFVQSSRTSAGDCALVGQRKLRRGRNHGTVPDVEVAETTDWLRLNCGWL